MSRPFASAPARGHRQGQEERERRSEEGGSVPGPRTFQVVSPGTQGAGPRPHPPSPTPQPAVVMQCAAGTLSPAVVTPGQEATLFRVEAVEEGEALVDGDVAGIGREFQLLAEDIVEEVEVVADEEQEQRPSQELEEKTVEEQGQERPGGPCERQELDALQALAALQVELSSEREQNRRAYVQFMRKHHQRRKRHLARRSAIIQGIPGFWAKAVSFALLLGVRCSGGRGRGEGAGAGGGGGGEGTGRAPEATEGNAVLGNWQAPKAQPSRAWAGPQVDVSQPCL